MRNLAIIMLMAGLLAPCAWAQNVVLEEDSMAAEAAVESTTTDTEEEDGKRVFKDRLVVTASRQEEASANTPAAISVITMEEIKVRQPEKMADLFKELPGVDVQGEGPFRGLPVIRGLSSNRVLILVDGQRLNNARESTVFAGIQPGLVDLAEVERIEVLRGPASVLYGSDAMGGVINIITKKPDLGAQEFTMHHNIGYEYGSTADSSAAHADIRGAGKGFGFNLSVGWETADDYKAPKEAAQSPHFQQYVLPDGTVPNSGMDQASVQGGFRMLTGDRGIFRTNVEIVRTDDVGFPGFDPETSGVDISFPRFDRDKISLGWESGPLAGLNNLSVSGYWQHVVKESKRFIDPSPFFFVHTYTKSDIETIGFNTQGIKDLGAHHLTMGLDFYRDNLEDEATNEYPWDSNTNVSVPKSHQEGIGLYIQDQFQAGDRLQILAGLRADHFAFKSEDDPNYVGEPFDVTESDISGNIGAMYAVTENVDLTALVARGFRAPNIQERAFTGSVSQPGYWVVQNPDLTSESSLNYEVGFKVRYDRYFGGVNLYYNDISDFITFVELGPDPITGLNLIQYDNIEDATVKGIEIELETLFSQYWTLITNYSYTKGDDDNTGEPLGFIPPWKAVLGLRYQAGPWYFEAAGRFVGEQTRVPSPENIADAEDDPPIGDFVTADIRAGYTFDSGLSLRATLGNIFDELYSEPFNLRPEPGRYMRMSVGWTF
ncbi:MAG: TonB-dependent receptor [Thermoanaerobaculales bacterium]|nr:TonB-dependent receptor [Thermoanaerobaculales bacterium]